MGVSPDKGAAHSSNASVVAREDGWLASYFDALSRITSIVPANGAVLNYLTEPERLKRFYAAIRGKVTSPGPARPVFRSNTDMMLLTTRLRLDPDGKPHIPGSLEVWRTLFVEHPQGNGSKYDTKLSKSRTQLERLRRRAGSALRSAEKIGGERAAEDLRMALSDVDRHRKSRAGRRTRRTGAGARIPASSARSIRIFAEAPEASNTTIQQFLDIRSPISTRIHDQALRADAAGKIRCRHWWDCGRFFTARAPSRPPMRTARFPASWRLSLKGEERGARCSRGRTRGRKDRCWLPRTTSAGVSAQDRMIDLLAGTALPDTSDAHTQLVEDMIRIFESQRLISLADIFQLVDQLESVAKGEKVNNSLITKTASRIAEIQLPRAPLSGLEKNSLKPTTAIGPRNTSRQQRKLNLRALIDHAATDPKKLDEDPGLDGAVPARCAGGV